MSTRTPLRITPKADATPTSTTDDRLNIPPTRRGKKFILAHAPSSWLFHPVAGWVPSLDIIIAHPGVNGVPDNGSLSGVVAQTSNNGSTVILPNDARLGEFKDYCIYYDTVDGGRHYCYKWETPSILPDRTVVWDRVGADAAYADFLGYLRDSGIVGTMHEAIYLRAIQAQEQRVNEIAARMGVNPALGTKLKAAEARLEAMQTAWAAMSNEKTTAPTGARVKGNVDAIL